MRDIMCTGYVAGGNTRFFGAKGKALEKAIEPNAVQEAMSARLSFDDDASGEYDSMLAFACPYGEDAASSRDQVISISERLLPWEVSKNQDPQKSYFPGGSENFKTYMNKFQLNQIHFGEDVRASESMAFMSQGKTLARVAPLAPPPPTPHRPIVRQVRKTTLCASLVLIDATTHSQQISSSWCRGRATLGPMRFRGCATHTPHHHNPLSLFPYTPHISTSTSTQPVTGLPLASRRKRVA